MFSQSIFAQLFRMTLLLMLTLVVVHHSPTLINVLAGQAVNSGCHQATSDDSASQHQHHHQHQHSHH